MGKKKKMMSYCIYASDMMKKLLFHYCDTMKIVTIVQDWQSHVENIYLITTQESHTRKIKITYIQTHTCTDR